MRRKLLGVSIIAVLSVLLLFMYDFNLEIFDYVLKKRGIKILAMLVVALSTAISTLLFQTVTGNRLLTPSVLGLDSLYVLLNLILAAALGAFTKWVQNPYLNFFLSASFMTGFAVLFYHGVFRRVKSIHTLVLIGMVMGLFFQSFTGMLQLLLNPDAFSFVMDKLFANFTDIKPDLLGISMVLVVPLAILALLKCHLLDVVSLGKDYAINLGVPYDKVTKNILVVVFVLLALSTALVGPITFLGFFSVNLCKTLFKTHRHWVLLIGTFAIAVIMLFMGQFFVEHVFDYGIPVSVVLNLVGGVYFIALLVKENKR